MEILHKTLNDHIALPKRPAAGRKRRAQKSPHRPPSHRTSTKPSGGSWATGAKPAARRARKGRRWARRSRRDALRGSRMTTGKVPPSFKATHGKETSTYLTMYQSDRSVRSRLLLNYHVSAPSGRVDLQRISYYQAFTCYTYVLATYYRYTIYMIPL